MACNTIKFNAHGAVRIILRDIEIENVIFVAKNGITIFDYPNDKPFPSRLVLGWINIDNNLKALHVVVAEDYILDTCIIVTAYWPDKSAWNHDFKTKKQ